jgi:hypothetical protein
VTRVAEVLTELHRRGVIVAVEGDILCLKPRRALDNGLLDRVREAKPAILEAPRNRPGHVVPRIATNSSLASGFTGRTWAVPQLSRKRRDRSARLR